MAARGSQRFDSLSSSLLSFLFWRLIFARSFAFFLFECLLPPFKDLLLLLTADSDISSPNIRFPVPPSCQRLDLICVSDLLELEFSLLEYWYFWSSSFELMLSSEIRKKHQGVKNLKQKCINLNKYINRKHKKHL